MDQVVHLKNDTIPTSGSVPRRVRIHYALYFSDLAALIITFLGSYFLLVNQYWSASLIDHGFAAVVVVFAFSVFSFSNGTYDWCKCRELIKHPLASFGGVIFAFGSFLLLGFLLGRIGDYSRLWLMSWFIAFFFYILFSRVVFIWYLARLGNGASLMRRAVILGASENGLEVLRHIKRFDPKGISVIGFVDDRMSRLPEMSSDVPLLGSTALVETLVRSGRIDLVLIALPWAAQERVKSLVERLSVWAVDIWLAPDTLGLQYADRPNYRIGGMHVMSLKDRPISEWNAVLKRLEDLVLAVSALTLISPLMIIVALAIKLESKGDVLFVQERFGFNNNIIKVYKFRSMYSDMTDRKGSRQTVRDDPRVTRVGKIIRKTSIDELPQLFNVILGCMSIVGPRPHPVGMQSEGQLLHDLLDKYASRHRVKPGITGWAQCNGWRGETDTREKIEKRVEHDLYYIENWSIFLDLLTLFKTVQLLFKRQDNAY